MKTDTRANVLNTVPWGVTACTVPFSILILFQSGSVIIVSGKKNHLPMSSRRY
jgi:hypothetical protein